MNWTHEANAWLIDNYTAVGPEAAASRFNTTRRAVIAHVSKLRQSKVSVGTLNCQTLRPWTIKEEAWLIANYRQGDADLAAKKLNRTELSIKGKVRQLRKQARMKSYSATLPRREKP